jgi:excisionase family DNA binding protein
MGIERFNAPSREAGANAVAVALAHIGKGFLLLSEAVEGLPKPEPVRVEARATRLLDAGEVAQRLKASKWSVYALMRSGALPFVAFGSKRRVRECDLEAFVASRLDSAI